MLHVTQLRKQSNVSYLFPVFNLKPDGDMVLYFLSLPTLLLAVQTSNSDIRIL